MKLKLFILGLIMLFTPIFANEIQSELQKHNSIQAKIDSIGVDILNYNKIPKRVVFGYNDVD